MKIIACIAFVFLTQLTWGKDFYLVWDGCSESYSQSQSFQDNIEDYLLQETIRDRLEKSLINRSIEFKVINNDLFFPTKCALFFSSDSNFIESSLSDLVENRSPILLRDFEAVKRRCIEEMEQKIALKSSEDSIEFIEAKKVIEALEKTSIEQKFLSCEISDVELLIDYETVSDYEPFTFEKQKIFEELIILLASESFEEIYKNRMDFRWYTNELKNVNPFEMMEFCILASHIQEKVQSIIADSNKKPFFFGLIAEQVMRLKKQELLDQYIDLISKRKVYESAIL